MKQAVEELSPELSVNDTILKYPATVAIFRAYGIDSCCGGPLPVAEAARRHSIDLDEIMGALDRVVNID